MSKLKNTNSNEFKAIVWQYLADSCYDIDDDQRRDLAFVARHVWARFVNEYNFIQNRVRYPNNYDRVAQWFMGLPLSFRDIHYGEIIERWSEWHGVELTEKLKDTICEKWFHFLAFKMVQLWQEQGLVMDWNQELAVTIWGGDSDYRVCGFVFNSVGDLIQKPESYTLQDLERVDLALTQAGEHISASRIKHLIRAMEKDSK